jgi:hypothetical protein
VRLYFIADRPLPGEGHAFFTRLENQFGRKQSKTVWRRTKSAPRARLQVETFEDRWVPSTLAVTSPLDDVNIHGTLRYAVAHAGNGDTILLTPAVGAAGITLTQGELLLGQQGLTVASATSAPTLSGR